MKRRWLIVLLLISLAFNLAVISMFFIHVCCHRPFGPPPFMMSRDRQEQPEGPQSMDKHRGMPEKYGFNREQMKPLRDDFNKLRLEFIQTLAADPFDQKAAEAALEKSLQSHRTMDSQIGSSMIQMRLKMTPADAKEFFGKQVDRIKEQTEHEQAEHNQPFKRRF